MIYRDIKVGNVLFDVEFNGKFGDFGLVKLYEYGINSGIIRVVGIFGYLVLELIRIGKFMMSFDVFVFGVLMLEVVCGRRFIEFKVLLE